MHVDVPGGKANLQLSSITLGDNMVFECRVMFPGDDEGKPADTARLVVLGNLSLSCDSCVYSSFPFPAPSVPVWHPGKGGAWPEHQPDMPV